MKNIKSRVRKYIAVVMLAVLVITTFSGDVMETWATTISEVQDAIDDTQNQLDEINDNISSMEDEQDLLDEQMEDLNAELINILTSIDMLEEDIAQKEADIALTQQNYEAALQKEQEQAEAMALQIRFMYETGDESFLMMLLNNASFSDMLNKITYAERVSAYNQEMLDKYEATRKEVYDLWDQLEADKVSLEQDKTEMENQKDYCDQLMATLQQKSDNYAAKIARAKQDAAAATALLQQEKKLLQQLEEEERRKEEERRRQEALAAAAAQNNGTSSPTVTGSSSYNSIIDNASGSSKGKEIAKYAVQFIGNPYVAGGTSLTNGADCSGFTYRIYQDFGYDIPRTSYSQRSAGKGVDYSEAQPGDLICYDGHVALYIGGGKIVHASTQKTGIKVSNADYRPILAVRRIV